MVNPAGGGNTSYQHCRFKEEAEGPQDIRSRGVDSREILTSQRDSMILEKLTFAVVTECWEKEDL